MKQDQKTKGGKKTTTRENKNKGKEGSTSSKSEMKNNDLSSGDTREEPAIPSTPLTPTAPPRREYEDPGHEHEYQPPKANPSYKEQTHGYVGGGDFK